jgi:molybdopterin synthase catalytic subunit
MKTLALSLLALASAALTASAQSEMRYFRHASAESETTIAIWMDGDAVGGTQYNGVPESHGAYGSFLGNVREDKLIHVTFNYEIEGNRQSEEQLIKLDKDKLIIGEGELEEHGPGQMTLKDPKKVTFDGTALKEVKMTEVEATAPEAKTVVEALKAHFQKEAGVAPTFDGTVRITGGWARYTGLANLPEGTQMKDKELAKRLSEDSLEVVFKQDGKGWKLIRRGFMAADGILEFDFESSEEPEMAPWPLEEDMNDA